MLKNVHPILDFLTRREKIYFIFFRFLFIFLCIIFRGTYLKKKSATPDRAEAQPSAGPPRASPLPARRRAAAGVRPGHAAPAAPFPKLRNP